MQDNLDQDDILKRGSPIQQQLQPSANYLNKLSHTNQNISIYTVQQQIQQTQNNENAINNNQLNENQQFDIPLLINFKSDNDSLIKELLTQKQQNYIIQDKKICIQQLCLQGDQSHIKIQEHTNHKKVQLSSLLKQLEIFKCNYHFTKNNHQIVISLLNSLDIIYHQILLLEQQITVLINNLKYNTYQHIKIIKDSFGFKYYQQAKSSLLSNFSSNNVKYLLSQIQKFKKIKYPNLQYPFYKIQTMKHKISQLNRDNKIYIIQNISKYIDKLLCNDTKDIKIKKSSSIFNFMNMNPSQKCIFSRYMTTQQYIITNNNKRITRSLIEKDQIPFSIIQKQLAHSIQIRIQIQQIEKGVFLGFCPITQLQKLQYKNVIQSQYSHFITNKGIILPIVSQINKLKSVPFKFGKNDIVTIKRSNNIVSFIKNAGSNHNQRYDVHLKLQQTFMHLYACIHLASSTSILRIVQ